MTRRQIQLVQQTWAQLGLVPAAAATIFYQRLFAIDPAAGTLFAATNMRSQREKLMLTLTEVVSNLEHTDQLQPRLEELGRLHVKHGVRPEHYVTVGDALMWMLEKMLAPEFNTEVRDAWVAAYDLISGAMLRAGTDSKT
jgi:hemoglobin-like flavoprotein